MWICLGSAAALTAHVEEPEPERLNHVDGIVVDPAGHPMANLEIDLVRDNKIAYQTKTGMAGEFRFDRVSGQFTLKIARSAFSAAVREIVVTDEIVTALERKKVYVILGPGACKDECSSVFTSKREFNRVLRNRNKH